MVFGKVLLAFCVILIIAVGLYRAKKHAQFVAARNELYKLGVPASLEEMNTRYAEVPAEENAAKLYRKAREAYSTNDVLEKGVPVVSRATDLPAPDEPLPSEMKETIQRYLDANATAFEFLHEAASLPQCRHPIDMRQGCMTEVPHLAKLRDATRMLGLKALMAAAARDSETATQSLLDALAAGRSLRNEPLLISQLVWIACDSVVFTFLRQVLNRTDLTNEQLIRLDESFAHSEAVRNVRLTLQGEACFFLVDYHRFLPYFQRYLTADATFETKEPIHARLFAALLDWSRYNDPDKMAYCRLMARLIHTAEQPYPAILEAFKTVRDEAEHLSTKSEYVTKEQFPAISKCQEAYARQVGIQRVARTALAIMRYRLDNNSLPGQLADVAPKYLDQVPQDPFDGAPLRYKPSTNGYLIYSIGADRKDEGGTDPEKGDPWGKSGNINIKVEFKQRP